MKQITVISGKGGTGKTTVTAALTKLAEKFVVADCDVDAADLHLLLNPKIGEKKDFYSGKGYQTDLNKCLRCGKCRELCRYEAISDDFVIDSLACDACGACYYVCPAAAISEKENLAGEYYLSSINKGMTPFIHANLHIAEDNSGKLVSQVRKEARRMAELTGAEYILIDGPPGIGCPVNAAIVGVDLALIVTEPTLSGIHDLGRIIDVCKHFNIKSKVVVNKYDINTENTKKIRELCVNNGSEFLAEIPYNQAVIESLIEGKTIIEKYPEHIISQELKNIWQKIK